MTRPDFCLLKGPPQLKLEEQLGVGGDKNQGRKSRLCSHRCNPRKRGKDPNLDGGNGDKKGGQRFKRCLGDRFYCIWQPTDWTGRLGVWRRRGLEEAGPVDGMSLTKVENRGDPCFLPLGVSLPPSAVPKTEQWLSKHLLNE